MRVWAMKRKKNLRKLLTLGHLDYTNQCLKICDYDLPYIECGIDIDIDYLALYGQPSTYNKTSNTAVCFMQYDEIFDGLYGLWNAIEYQVKDLIDFYKDRFKNVKIFISPDYSKCGDVENIHNLHQEFKQRVVSVFLTIELGAVVIPLVSACTEEFIPYSIIGMDNCKTIAFNAKCATQNDFQKVIFVKTINYAVDNLKQLKHIIVYSDLPDDDKILELFSYAIKKGIKVSIPDNMLLSRLRILHNRNGINK